MVAAEGVIRTAPRAVRLIFLAAGIYGLIVLLPLYGGEPMFARMGYRQLDHPEYFYGFVGAACAMQVMYLIISRDPLRYRPMMVIGVLGKLGYGVPVLILRAVGRLDPLTFWVSMPDLLWAVLFALAWRMTRDPA